MKKNPFAPQVPCHRVVSASMDIGGFNGKTGDCESTRRKISMLKSEGVVFNGTRVDTKSLHSWKQ